METEEVIGWNQYKITSQTTTTDAVPPEVLLQRTIIRRLHSKNPMWMTVVYVGLMFLMAFVTVGACYVGKEIHTATFHRNLQLDELLLLNKETNLVE